MEHLILSSVEHSPSNIERSLFCGSVALCLSILALLHWITSNLGQTRCARVVSFYRLGGVVFVLVIAAASSYLSTLVLMALVATSCAIEVVFDLTNTLKSRRNVS